MSSSVSTLGNFLEKNKDTISSGFSLLNTGISAYASYQSTVIKSNMMRVQARQQELQARQERLKGAQQGNILRDQLLNNLSAANALFSARGVDVGSRSALALAARNISTVSKDIGLLEQNAEIRGIGAQAKADVLRIGAKSVKQQGRHEVIRQLFGETSQKAVGSLISGFSRKKTTEGKGL